MLKKLSSKHLITHILPVVMSLKHVLEASKSPLQGPLMEYLVHLMKQHRPDVDEALQFDPTLKAEIEYDLKHYEKNKRRDSSSSSSNNSRHSPMLSVAAIDEVSNSTGPVAMLSSDRLPTGGGGTIVRPVLKRSLGGSEGRGRTPSDALKSPGKLLSHTSSLSLHLYLCIPMQLVGKWNHHLLIHPFIDVSLYAGLHLGSGLIYSVMKTDRSSSKGGGRYCRYCSYSYPIEYRC